VTDWLSVCREATDAVRSVVAGLPTRAEREPSSRVGEGGDETTAIDEAAEQAVVARLEALHADGVDFTLVSEELGERRYGQAAEGLVVVVDPIDGSMNATRGIPFFSVSIAVAEGPAMRDVVFGFVADLGTGEEWSAKRGERSSTDVHSRAWVPRTRSRSCPSKRPRPPRSLRVPGPCWASPFAFASWARSHFHSATSLRGGSTLSAH
jgi:fructose-1,6-bisphosphatase/inositol monophosphatase family enzyme